MSENKRYKIIRDNLGEYSVLRHDNTIVNTEIQYKATAELFCDELNDLVDQIQELEIQLEGYVQRNREFAEVECSVTDIIYDYYHTNKYKNEKEVIEAIRKVVGVFKKPILNRGGWIKNGRHG